MNLLTGLKKYGLSETESKVYLYLIENIDSNVFNVSKGTGVARTTVYSTLESLEAMGLVVEWKKNGVSFFGPESPNKLKRMLKEKEDILDEILPGIRALGDRESVTPVTKVYLGEKGIQMGFTDALDTAEKEGITQRYVYTHPDIGWEKKYFAYWIKRKENIKLFTHLIGPKSMKGKPSARDFYSPNKYRDVRFIDDKFMFKHTFDITGTRLGFYSIQPDQTYAILVYSETMAETFRQFFMYVWSTLEE